MNTVAVILAGGIGERLWPQSRRMYPKQFLSITNDDESMLQKTVGVISDFLPNDNIYIISNQIYKSIIEKQLPCFNRNNIIYESLSKNTAACIGVAAEIIKRRYNDASIIFLPSDHMITKRNALFCALNTALDNIEIGDKIFTLGIKPTYPEVGYGYIRYENITNNCKYYKVEDFIEKPDYITAQSLIEKSNCLWNSGIYICKASSILKSIQNFIPEVYELLGNINDAWNISKVNNSLRKLYSRFPSISIDKGVIEKSKNLYTVPCDIGWDDIGSWIAIERIEKKDNNNNSIQGNVIQLNCSDCIICEKAPKRLVSSVGLKDIIIVDTPDVLLVCKKSEAESIKELLELIDISNKSQYL